MKKKNLVKAAGPKLDAEDDYSGQFGMHVWECPHAAATVNTWTSPVSKDDGIRCRCPSYDSSSMAHRLLFVSSAGDCVQFPFQASPVASLAWLGNDRHARITCKRDGERNTRTSRPRRPDLSLFYACTAH